MSYVSYDKFLPAIVPFCNGVPDELAIDAARNAAIEFCEETHWLQYTPDAVTGIVNIASYQLETPNDTIMARVAEAWYNTFPLTPQTEEQLVAKCGVDWRTLTGGPSYYLSNDDATVIVLVPMPSVTLVNGLTSIVVLRPTRASTTVDGDLYEKWYEVIAAGAKSRLQSTPAQSYTSPTAAARSEAMFRSGIAKARIERNRGLSRTNMVLRPPRFV